MASVSGVNAVTGWEIVPFVPPPFPPMMVQLQNAPVVVEEQKRRRRGRKDNPTTLVGFSYVSFHYARAEEIEGSKGLVMSESKDAPNPDENDSSRYSAEELKLPAPAILKGWKRETRKRVNGLRDKFYTHPLTITKFRSLVEVVGFIIRKNKLDVPGAAQEVQDVEGSLNKSSSSSKKKRGKRYYVRKTESGEERIYPVGVAVDEREANKRFVESFLAAAYDNLMNSFSSTPSAGGGAAAGEPRGPKTPRKRQRVNVLIRVGSDGVHHVQQVHHSATPPPPPGYSINLDGIVNASN